MKRALITALAAALVLIGVAAAIAAREESLAPRAERTGEERADEPQRDDQAFVDWIPIMVPLSAVLLAVLVYLIAAAVL